MTSTARPRDLGDCNCWVAKRPIIERFGLRWGAHSLTCPAYRESRDPADRIRDEINRKHGEAEGRE